MPSSIVVLVRNGVLLGYGYCIDRVCGSMVAGNDASVKDVVASFRDVYSEVMSHAIVATPTPVELGYIASRLELNLPQQRVIDAYTVARLEGSDPTELFPVTSGVVDRIVESCMTGYEPSCKRIDSKLYLEAVRARDIVTRALQKPRRAWLSRILGARHD